METGHPSTRAVNSDSGNRALEWNELPLASHLLHGSHAFWKVMEFKKGIFQDWKVMENDCGHGKSWNSTSKSWNFVTEG